MKRRTVLAMLGVSAIASPWVARAQQSERVRKVGLLFNTGSNDPETGIRLDIFTRGCAALGWVEGKNLRIDFRGVEHAGPAGFAQSATELAALAPDLFVAGNGAAARPLRERAPSVPVVFVNVNEPVTEGLVESLVWPGGTMTGFAKNEAATNAKLLPILKEMVPSLTRVLWAQAAGESAWESSIPYYEAAARAAGVTLTRSMVRSIEAFEPQLAEFARTPDGGVIMPAFTADYRRVAALAVRYRVPAIYTARIYVTGGGLVSYSPDIREQWRLAPSYVDRILRGENPGHLPVQQPTKFDLVLNRKAADAIGLTIPPSLLARADEVIE